MNSQPKSKFKISKVGRPDLNVLRDGVPSKICFLCYGKPLSKYEVSMELYGQPMANVQNWMTRLAKNGYLRKVKRKVPREADKRPKGDTGYQLVVSKIVEELDRTLIENTSGALAFSHDEQAVLAEFLDSSEARNLASALVSPNIRQDKSNDLCAMFTTIFWTHTSGVKRGGPTDANGFARIEKHVEDPRFTRVISDAVKKTGAVGSAFLGSVMTEEETRHYTQRYTEIKTFIRILKFARKLSDFMSSCEQAFVEKLRWCGQPTSPSAYGFAKVADELPSILKEIRRSAAIRDLLSNMGDDVQ